MHGESVIGDTGAADAGAADAGAAAPTGLDAQRVGRDLLSAALTAMIAGPISHVPSVVAAHQQAHAVSIGTACATLRAAAPGFRGFWAGILPRTASLTGSLFVMPFSIELLQPLVEKHRHRWRV
jgi:hypothetical protein